MTTTSIVPLKYLFTATFADGTTIEQTPEDRSAIDPEKRSQFFDVLERSKSVKLVAFVLKGEGREYGVDLRDGHFEIDGVPFVMHEAPIPAFELIFFRRHTHTFHQGREKNTELAHDVVYRIGWKALHDQNYQRVMQID